MDLKEIVTQKVVHNAEKEAEAAKKAARARAEKRVDDIAPENWRQKGRETQKDVIERMKRLNELNPEDYPGVVTRLTGTSRTHSLEATVFNIDGTYISVVKATPTEEQRAIDEKRGEHGQRLRVPLRQYYRLYLHYGEPEGDDLESEICFLGSQDTEDFEGTFSDDLDLGYVKNNLANLFGLEENIATLERELGIQS